MRIGMTDHDRTRPVCSDPAVKFRCFSELFRVALKALRGVALNLLLLRFAGEAENPLAEDVAHDVRCSAHDCVSRIVG